MNRFRRALGLLLLAAPLLAGSPGWADGTDAQGAPPSDPLADFWRDEKASLALRTDYYDNSKTLDGEKNPWGGTAEFRAYPLVDSGLDGKADARLTEPNWINGDSAAFDLVEGYAAFHLGSFDLRVGKQVVAWGKADGINPTDNLTPRDLTLQLPFDEDFRFGTWSLKLDYYLDGEVSLTLFTTPFFEPTKFPLPPGSGFSFRADTPAQTLANSEVALKLAKTGGDFDWSLSYFRGYRLFPDVNLDGNDPSTGTIDIHYSQVDVVGADFARNLGPFGLRGEAAYFHPTGPDPSDPNQIRPYFFGVLGADRSFDQELNLNVQVIARFVQDFAPLAAPNPAALQVDQLNAIVNNQQDPESCEMSFRVSDNWMNETLGAEVFGVIDLTRNDGYLRPSVNYAFNDRVKGWIGYDLYYGYDNTQFGFLKPIQGLFSELRYTF